MSQAIEEMIQEIEAELATITDLQKREEERQRIKSLLMRYAGKDKIVTMKDVVEADRGIASTLREYPSGYKGLDAMIRSFRDTELVVISGPTKNGKTTLAMSLTKNFLSQNVVPCWFSYEMTPMEFAEKIGEDSLPIIYTPQSLVTNKTEWLERKIVEAIAKHDANVFFIDHLHYVCDISGKGNENTSVRIGRTLREIKQMAVKWNVCIFLIAHTTKIKQGEEPSVSSLRDSSFVAQEANTVIYVQRQGTETSHTNMLNVSVIANRRTGENGTLELEYDPQALYLKTVWN